MSTCNIQHTEDAKYTGENDCVLIFTNFYFHCSCIGMEKTMKREIARAIMSDMDKLQMENHVLTNKIDSEDAEKEVKSIFSKEEQRWLDEYIKDHNADRLFELLDIE